MVNYKDPSFSRYSLPNSRPDDDPLIMSENYGQLYIGLQRQTEFSDGSIVLNFVPLNKTFMNFKIDFYNEVELVERKDLERCSDSGKDTFLSRAERSSGIKPTDFDNMYCVDEDQFLFFNEAGTPKRNSITLIFEQCGGKYTTNKSSSSGSNWVWIDPNCDPLTEDCSLGLKPTPEQIARLEQSRN